MQYRSHELGALRPWQLARAVLGDLSTWLGHCGLIADQGRRCAYEAPAENPGDSHDGLCLPDLHARGRDGRSAWSRQGWGAMRWIVRVLSGGRQLGQVSGCRYVDAPQRPTRLPVRGRLRTAWERDDRQMQENK